MFGLIGLLFGLILGLPRLAFGVSRFTIKNALRVGIYGLVGYAVYELIVGITQGREAAKAADPAAAAPTPRPALPSPTTATANAPAAAPTRPNFSASTDHAGLTGADKQGQAVRVVDAGGVAHTTRVGRGIIHR